MAYQISDTETQHESTYEYTETDDSLTISSKKPLVASQIMCTASHPLSAMHLISVATHHGLARLGLKLSKTLGHESFTNFANLRPPIYS